MLIKIGTVAFDPEKVTFVYLDDETEGKPQTRVCLGRSHNILVRRSFDDVVTTINEALGELALRKGPYR